MEINIQKNELKGRSSIIENMNSRDIAGEGYIKIEENKLQDEAAILRMRELQQEELEKQKIYNEINEKIGEFSDWSDEYKTLQALKQEISKKESRMPQIVKKFGYDITKGCLVNTFSKVILKIIEKYLNMK